MRNSLKDTSLKNIPVGSPEYFSIQKQLIRDRPLLKRCYDDWYARLRSDAESVSGNGCLVELGSGGSLLDDVLPDVITSDVVEGVADRVIDARHLPFDDDSIKALFLTHVFHHIPDVRAFLSEAARTLVPGGVISMIEVAHTPLAKFVFGNFHPEPYEDKAMTWEFNQADSMMDSNQALSWIVFFRDRKRFSEEFPGFDIEVSAFTPWLSYLLSGGVSKKQLVPRCLSGLVFALEKPLAFLSPFCALHWHIRLRKRA
jgi:SAM-dependent methyltransferase